MYYYQAEKTFISFIDTQFCIGSIFTSDFYGTLPFSGYEHWISQCAIISLVILNEYFSMAICLFVYVMSLYVV